MMNVQFPLSPHSQLITISINKVPHFRGRQKVTFPEPPLQRLARSRQMIRDDLPQ